MRNDIINFIEENYPHDKDNILLADGYEDAFVGVSETFGSIPKACYDTDKCLNILINRDGMEPEEAAEFFNYNTLGAYVGVYTPVFVKSFKRKNVWSN